MSAPVPKLRQTCEEAFRSFEIRNREQHPRSDVSFRFVNNNIFAVCSGCDGRCAGDLLYDPITNSVLVMPTEMLDGSMHKMVWKTLDAFAEEALAAYQTLPSATTMNYAFLYCRGSAPLRRLRARWLFANSPF